MPESDYTTKCLTPCQKIVEACKKMTKLCRYIEVSTAQVYEADKKPSKESDKLKPWTMLAKARLQAEEVVRSSGLPWVILRPVTVYGPGDMSGTHCYLLLPLSFSVYCLLLATTHCMFSTMYTLCRSYASYMLCCCLSTY